MTLLCELVQAPWPLLMSLSLSDNHLQREGVSFLITGEGPMMEQMYLKNIDLGEIAVDQVCKARDRPDQDEVWFGDYLTSDQCPVATS